MKKKLLLATLLTLLLVLTLSMAQAATQTYTYSGKAPRVGETFTLTHTDGCGNPNATCTVTVAPTCTTAGAGTGFCDECGSSKANFDVVIYLSSTSHTWGNYYVAQVDGECGHTRRCSNCRVEETPGVCSWVYYNDDYTTEGTLLHRLQCTVCKYYSLHFAQGGTATCTEKAKCSLCGTGYGEVLGHNYATVKSYNDSTHTLACTRCTSTKSVAHTMGSWVENSTQTCRSDCTTCDYYTTATHAYNSWSYQDEEYHVDNCARCGYAEDERHTWVATSYNNSTHTANCATCGTTKTMAHNMGYWLNLDGENYDNYYGVHQRDCQTKGCGYYEQGKHEWSEWIITDEYHHVYCTTNYCAAFYNDPHTMTIVSQDATTHTTACSMCGGLKTTEEHTWSSWMKTKTPTCTEGGVQVRYCTECKYTQTEYLDPLGHQPGRTVIAKQPTCTETGLRVTSCALCGTTVQTYDIAATGHQNTVENTVVEATCCTTGKIEVYCNDCKSVTETKTVSATGNHKVEWRVTKPATCTTNGVETKYCANSGKSLNATRGIAAPGHKNYYYKTTEATCTTNGKTETYCGECDALISTAAITAPGHDWSAWGQVSAPTCMQEGKESRVCNNEGCDAVEYQAIAKRQHTMTSKVHVAATCTDMGYTMYYCNQKNPSCTYYYIEQDIPKVEHSYVATTVNCNGGFNRGYDADVCSACGDTVNKVAHVDTYKDVKLEPTCCGTGWYNNCCAECNLILADKLPIDPTGVNHKEARQTKSEATCTEAEVVEVYCTEQGYRYLRTEEGEPAKGHTEGAPVVVTAATCCTEGKQEIRCSVCDTLLRTETIPATGHGDDGEKDTEWRVTKEATCVEDGEETKFCVNTGDNLGETRVIPATGHTFGDWTVDAKDPTKEIRVCSECGATETRTNQNPPVPEEETCEHPNKIKIPAIDPTCTEYGVTASYYCPDCEVTWVTGGRIDPLGHNYTEWTLVAGSKEIEFRVCLRCNYIEYKYVGTNIDPVDCAHTNTISMPGYPATCEEPGLTGHEFCLDCGSPITLPTEIAPTGHQNLVVIPAVPATPTQNGKTAGLYCGDCGKILVMPQEVTYAGDPVSININGIVVTPEQDEQIGQVVNNVYTDMNGNVIGTFQPDGTLVDANGNVVGTLEGDHIHDATGTHVGTIVDSLDDVEDEDSYIYVDGIVIDPATGEVIGEVENNVYTDNNGNVIGTFQPDGTLVDPNGQVIGDLDGDKIYDNDGNHVGTIVDGVDEDKYIDVNGTVVTPDGETVLGKVEHNDYTDVNGNDVGTFLPDGTLVDENGETIGHLEGDYIYDNDGNHVGTIVDTTMIPGHPDFDLDDYLDDYYTHVENGEEIRPNIDDDQCVIGTEQDETGEKVLISGAEDYAICPNDQYPMSQWIPTGDGNHVRVCTCVNCDYSETSACVYFEITANEVLYKVCPICGHFGDEQFEHVKGVKVGGDGHLHELFVREYAEPFGAEACTVKNYAEQPVAVVDAFTAAKSVKGDLIAWGEVESLYVPMPNPGNVMLVCMNMNGEFTEVPFVYDNGMIMFQADDHGLYLMINK